MAQFLLFPLKPTIGPWMVGGPIGGLIGGPISPQIFGELTTINLLFERFPEVFHSDLPEGRFDNQFESRRGSFRTRLMWKLRTSLSPGEAVSEPD